MQQNTFCERREVLESTFKLFANDDSNDDMITDKMSFRIDRLLLPENERWERNDDNNNSKMALIGGK